LGTLYHNSELPGKQQIGTPVHGKGITGAFGLSGKTLGGQADIKSEKLDKGRGDGMSQSCATGGLSFATHQRPKKDC